MMTPPSKHARFLSHRTRTNFQTAPAFSLVEILVAMTVLVLLMVLAAQVIDRTQRIWSSANSKLEQFREARIGFDDLTERLSKATLFQYFGYTNTLQTLPLVGTVPAPLYFGRRSELRFICGPAAQVVSGTTPSTTDAVFFTAPLGITSSASYARLPGLLNMCGYFIEWSNVDPDRPLVLGGSGSYRFRLMQFVQPAENMVLYPQTTGGAASFAPKYTFVTATNWQINAMQSSPTSIRPVANNVVALLMLPALSTSDTSGSLAPAYLYDSQANGAIAATANPSTVSPTTNSFNRLPPVVRVVLYTIDEFSAQKLPNTASMPNLSGTLFQDPTKLYPAPDGSDPGDLGRFEQVLIQKNLTFRRFETAVQLPPQPWSTQQDF